MSQPDGSPGRGSRTGSGGGKAAGYRLVSVVLSCLCCLCICVLLAVLLVIVPKFSRTFEALEAELPGLTRAVIGASHLVRDWSFVVLPLAAAVMAGLICLSLFLRHPINLAIGAVLLAILVLSTPGLIVLAMYLPLQGLTRSMQSN
jgi:type II secretory pathway component PulF